MVGKFARTMFLSYAKVAPAESHIYCLGHSFNQDKGSRRASKLLALSLNDDWAV